MMWGYGSGWMLLWMALIMGGTILLIIWGVRRFTGSNRQDDSRALAILERTLGPDHPRVARDLNNLAQLLQDTSRLADAEPLIGSIDPAAGTGRRRLQKGQWRGPQGVAGGPDNLV